MQLVVKSGFGHMCNFSTWEVKAGGPRFKAA